MTVSSIPSHSPSVEVPREHIIKRRVAGRMAAVFERMERERFLFDHLSRIELGKGLVGLAT